MTDLDISILRFHKLMHLQSGKPLIQKITQLMFTSRTKNTEVRHFLNIQVSTNLKVITGKSPNKYRIKNCSMGKQNIARSKSWLKTANQPTTQAR